MYRLQQNQQLFQKKQEEDKRAFGNQEVLQVLQEAYSS